MTLDQYIAEDDAALKAWVELRDRHLEEQQPLLDRSIKASRELAKAKLREEVMREMQEGRAA